MLRCPHRLGLKRCRGLIERGMAYCEECGGDLEGLWKEMDVLMSPGAGLPAPTRKPQFGKVQRLGKRIHTYAGVAVERPVPSLRLEMRVTFDDVESYDQPVVSIEHARRRRARKTTTMKDDDRPLRRIEYWQNADGEPKDLGEAWRVTKNGHVARCAIVGHPLGHEVRMYVDGEPLPMTQVCKSTEAIAAVTEDWRAAFLTKGWSNEAGEEGGA